MTALLRFDGVTLNRGGRLLFEALSFELNAGDALQITGANGSGKSSLIRLAAGLLEESGGAVERAGAVALADDNAALDRELPLARALAFWGGDVDAALGAVGLAPFRNVPVRLLSSGQLKRATLARVAASGASLWLLDEPLNGLDQQSSNRLYKLIDEHRRSGGAVVAASHQPLEGEWHLLGLAQ